MPFLTLGVLFCSIYFGGPAVTNYRETIGFALDPLLFALLLIQWVALSDHPLWSWLNSRPMRYLGRISYPLYLYQQVTLYPVRRILHAQPVWLQLGVAVAVTVGVASLSYYCIERPFLRWKRRFQTDAPPPLKGAF
jgi:peptidoglycan/LPS O-acetylase OafA/YrhL